MPSPSDWISVSDRLPEPDTDVLVTLRFSDGTVITSRHAAHYAESKGWMQWRDNKSAPFEGEVTHWRPLPEPGPRLRSD